MTAAADDEPGNLKAKHKRTRTGCMKCRVRRRKCDEGKPRCQRCVDGGFDCQYGPRLTFLDKNVMTVSRGPAPASATTTAAPAPAPQYARLQFVGPAGATSNSPAEARPTSPVSSETLPSHDAPSEHKPPVPVPDIQHPPPPEEQPQVVFQDDTAMHDWPSNPAPITPQTPGVPPPRHVAVGLGTSPKDPAYETALNVLLSLGSDMPTPGFPGSPSAHMHPNPHTMALQGSPTSSVPSLAAMAPDHTLTQDRLLQLLRYYRYQVAPWLDICDMGQSFGLAVARLAVESEGTLSALLALASRAQHDDGHAAASDAEYLDALSEASLLRQQGIDPFSDPYLAQVALATTCRFVTSIPTAWQGPTSVVFGEHFLAGALEHAGTKMRASILSLLLRLELTAAMINGSSTVSVPDHIGYVPDTPTTPGSPHTDDSMFRYATDALLLCARAVSFHALPFAPQAPGAEGAPVTPVQRWTALNDALAAWYAGRPHEFRPMAEMEGEESLFPVVLFTNGAAVLANQLYHTAMLLLLQSRPRTLQAASRKSSAASHLWHAQRVCGICLNNDRRDSWDLCLVASLFLAAQRLTYEPQQRAILDCLNRVRIITGWDLSNFAAELQETWGGGVRREHE